jgi:hypothetical protein
MFEYLNSSALGVIIFLTIVAILGDIAIKKKGISWFLYILIIIIYGLLFSDANEQFVTARENINNFKNSNAVLKCAIGGGLYSSLSIYRVSRDGGWSLEKDYFVKDSLMVKASRCTKW